MTQSNTARFWKEAIFVFSHFIWGNSRFAINKKAILFYRLTGSTGQYDDLMEPFIFHYIKLCLFLSVGLYIVEDNGYDKLPQKISRRFFPGWGGNKQNKTKKQRLCNAFVDRKVDLKFGNEKQKFLNELKILSRTDSQWINWDTSNHFPSMLKCKKAVIHERH